MYIKVVISALLLLLANTSMADSNIKLGVNADYSGKDITPNASASYNTEINKYIESRLGVDVNLSKRKTPVISGGVMFGLPYVISPFVALKLSADANFGKLYMPAYDVGVISKISKRMSIMAYYKNNYKCNNGKIAAVLNCSVIDNFSLKIKPEYDLKNKSFGLMGGVSYKINI